MGLSIRYAGVRREFSRTDGSGSRPFDSTPRLDAHLQPVELLLQPVERGVADLLACPHVEDDAAGRGERAAMEVATYLTVADE